MISAGMYLRGFLAHIKYLRCGGMGGKSSSKLPTQIRLDRFSGNRGKHVILFIGHAKWDKVSGNGGSDMRYLFLSHTKYSRVLGKGGRDRMSVW
jgi:hypothetical protein